MESLLKMEFPVAVAVHVLIIHCPPMLAEELEEGEELRTLDLGLVRRVLLLDQPKLGQKLNRNLLLKLQPVP
jgi:hypothetical protein